MRVSAGRVFSRAFATIFHNPLVTLGLALLFGAIPGAISTYVVSAAQIEAIESGNAAAGWGFAGIMLLSFIIGLVIAALVQGVMTRATVAESQGRKASFGECIGAALAVLLPLIGLSLLLAIAVAIGFILLIVPGVMLYLAWCVAAPALVEERAGVMGSFARSNQLTKGARWKILGIMLVLVVVYYLISAAVAVIGMTSFETGPEALPAMTPSFIVASIVMGTLINVFWGAVQASLYVELRAWKDGPAGANLEEVFG